MSVDNPAQRMFKNPEKEGGTRIEIDCEKGIMIVRVTKPHSITGKTEMTKVNVDYPAIALVSPATHSRESRPGYTAPPRPSRTPRSASSTTS